MFVNFHWKNFMLECYVLRKLVLEKFYLVKRCWFNDFLLYFGRFYVIERLQYYEISLIFLVSKFKTKQDS